MHKIVKKVNYFEERWLGERRCLVKIDLSNVIFYDTVVIRALKVLCKYGHCSSVVGPVVIIEGGTEAILGKINEIAEQVFNYILFGNVILVDGWELDELNWSDATVLTQLANLREEFYEHLRDLRREYFSLTCDLRKEECHMYPLDTLKSKKNWEELSRRHRLAYSLIESVYTDLRRFAKRKGFY